MIMSIETKARFKAAVFLGERDAERLVRFKDCIKRTSTDVSKPFASKNWKSKMSPQWRPSNELILCKQYQSIG